MKKVYNSPSITVTTYASIDRTNNIKLEASVPIQQQYDGTDKIANGTFKLNDLNQ